MRKIDSKVSLTDWIYRGKPFTQTLEEVQGFVYCITNPATGRKYVGKKNMWSIQKRPPLKGKTNRRHRRIETDWQSYYGSNKTLLSELEHLDPHTLTREILHLCANKNQMTYYEMLEQFTRNVLLDDGYYNEYIGGRCTARGLV